jgi:hypothetical protein
MDDYDAPRKAGAWVSEETLGVRGPGGDGHQEQPEEEGP